jgi:hypothetical protein
VGFPEEGSTAKPAGVQIKQEAPKKKSAGFSEPEPEAQAPKKEKKGGGLKFADGTKDDKEAKAHQPGTPFVKLGNTFDDLYDSEEEDSDEDSDEEGGEKDDWDSKSVKSVKSEKPKKKKGGKIGFAADEEGHDGDEKSTLVPGTLL